MSKVLFVYERNIPTVSIMYGVFGNEAVREWGMDVEFKSIKQIKRNDVKNCDVLILIRPNNSFSAALAKNARKSGKFIITFCDDDLLNLPKSMPNIPWRKKALIKTLCNSHMVCSSSKYICQKYSRFALTDRYAILNTALTQEQLNELQPKRSVRNDKVKIVYAAGSDHAELFEKYVSPVMDELAKKYKDKISFTFVGVRPELKEYENKIEINYIESMKLSEYRQFMRDRGFDIGLAPLHDDEFTKCKYFNKFIEYTMSGIVGIYSAVEPYTFAVEDEKNGFLADNSPESWNETISKAIERADLRAMCLENACNKLRQDFDLQGVLRNLTADAPELVEFSTKNKIGRIAFAKLKYKLLRPIDMIYSALFSLFHGGVRGFVKKWKMHNMERRSNSEIEVNK